MFEWLHEHEPYRIGAQKCPRLGATKYVTSKFGGDNVQQSVKSGMLMVKHVQNTTLENL